MPQGMPIATYPSMIGNAALKAACMLSELNTNGDYTSKVRGGLPYNQKGIVPSLLYESSSIDGQLR